MSKNELWTVFTGLIRSVLEYAAPLFISLSKSLCKQIELIQNRAHKIICGAVENCGCVLSTLESCRIDLALLRYNLNRLRKHFHAPMINRTQRRNSFFIKCAINCDHIVADWRVGFELPSLIDSITVSFPSFDAR